MNKQQFIEKCSWKKLLRLRPIPKRYDGGPQGQELPALVLNWDNILEYSSDPIRGERYGFLHLKVQLHMGGDQIWVEPLVGMRG